MLPDLQGSVSLWPAAFPAPAGEAGTEPERQREEEEESCHSSSL